jgi:HK97 family phage major capsid protein
MKLTEMYAKRDALTAERDSILASNALTVEQEARGMAVANELDVLLPQIRKAQFAERVATQAAVSGIDSASEERATEQRATTRYRDQFIAYMRGQGPAPELREVNTTMTGAITAGTLIPKVYEDGILKYLMANTIVRNLADIRTGVQGYPTVRWNTLEPSSFTNAWTGTDVGGSSSANDTNATSTDPGFSEKAFAPQPVLPFTTVSRQTLIQSNFDVEAEVIDTLQRQLAKNLEWGYIAGSGTKQPTGIFKLDSNCQQVDAGTAATGLTRQKQLDKAVTVANLLSMRYNKLSASYWNAPNTCWIMPQDVYAAVSSLTSGITNSVVPIFAPSSDFQALPNAAPMTLFGLPIYVTEYVSTDLTANATQFMAVLGNISDAYSIREWGGMTMIRDEISAAATARIKFYAMAFAQGAVTRSKALVQLKVANGAS